MNNRYFQITYDFDKLSDDEKHTILTIASQNWQNGKAVSAGWESVADVENDGWISVDDELPTTPDVYLVCVSNAICFQHSEEAIEIVSYHPITGWNTNYDITYWQPMPQLPEE